MQREETREDKKRPDFDVRLHGVRLAVWTNETDGRRWYSAAPSRRVAEPGSKDARYFTTFNGVADLVLLRAAIDQAIDWMNCQQDEKGEDEGF